MGIFGSLGAVVRLERRLDDVENQCADLKREAKKLDLEFTEIYDKVSHQMSRMAKRGADRAKKNGPDPDPEVPISPLDGLDPISRAIHERRGTTSFLAGETE